MSTTRILYELVGVDKVSPSFSRAGRSADTFGTKMASLGKKAVHAAALMDTAMAGAAVQSVKAAASFQASMTRIQTQAGATAGDVRKLSAEVLKLGKTSQQGPQELAEGLFHLKSLGLDNARAMKALKQSSDLAAISGADLEETTNALGGAWRSGIKGAKSFSGTVATLNAIAGAGNMRMQDLVDAMSTGILPAARTFGVSLKSVGSALALMTDEGIPAQDAATRLRMTLSLLGAPSKQASKVLAKIGLSGIKLGNAMRGPQGLIGAVQLLQDHLQKSGLDATHSAKLLSRAFGGGRSSSAIMTLLNNLTVLKQKQDQINSSMGRFGPAVAAQQKTASAQFALLKSNLDVLEIQFGQRLLPDAIDLVKWLSNNQKTAITLAATFGGLAITITGLNLAIKSILTVTTVARAFGAAATGIRSFSSAAVAAAAVDKGLAAAQLETAAANTTFAVGADGAVAALGKMTVAGKSWAIVSAAIAGISPFAWAAGAAVGLAALGVVIAREKNTLDGYANSLKAADKASGFNISGYQKLAGQLNTQAKLHDQVAKSLQTESTRWGGLYGSAAGVRGEYTVLSRTQTEASTTAGRLVLQLGQLQTEFGITRTQAEQLAVKAGVSANQLAASGKSGAQAALKIQKYATGAGAAAVKEDQLTNATSKFTGVLSRLDNMTLALQGDTLSWRQSQIAAKNAVDQATKGLKGNSGAAINAKQSLLESTRAASSLAKWMVTVKGNVSGASSVLRQQIKFLQQHGEKSKFAAQEIAILRQALSKLHNKNLKILVDGHGQYSLQSIAAAGGAASQHGSGGGGSRRTLAAGGRLAGYGGGDIVPALLEPGEAVVDKVRARRYAPVLSAMGVPGYASGGIVPRYSGSIKGEGPWITGDYNATAAMIEKATAKITAQAIQAQVRRQAAMGGVGSYGARTGSVAVEQAFARAHLGDYGWGAAQMAPLIALWNRESGWNPYAVNSRSGAYGIPQSLGHGHPYNLGDYKAQELWGLGYVASRYGSPAAAWAHEESVGWYKDGTLNVPSTGPAIVHAGEMVLPETVADQVRAALASPGGQLRMFAGMQASSPAAAGRALGVYGQKLMDGLIGGINSRQATLRNVLQKMSKSIASQLQAARQMASSVTSGARSYAALSSVSQIANGGRLTAAGIDAGLQGFLRTIRQFSGSLHRLGKAGLSNALISQIAGMEPDQGLKVAKALLAGPAVEIRRLNRTERQITRSTRHLGRSVADRIYDNGPRAGKGYLTGLKAQQRDIGKLLKEKHITKVNMRVFIGDREITDIIRTEITKEDRKKARKIKSGSTR